MNQLYLTSRNFEVNYPSSWEEITERQAGKIGEILHLCYTGRIDYDLARKSAVDVFLNRVNGVAKHEESWNYWGNEAMLMDSVDFLFKKSKGRNGEDQVSIDPKFCVQLIPQVRKGLRWLVGPKDLISDLTIYEFKEAGWRVSKYAETQEEEFLNELFAILYKRGGLVWGRKKRPEAFSDCEYERMVKQARRVPIGIRFMAYLFFLGCMNWAREECIEIDGAEIHFGCLFGKPDEDSGGKGDNTGMAGLLYQMAESGVFGNMEQTRRVNVWDFLLRLYQIHNQVKKQKQP